MTPSEKTSQEIQREQEAITEILILLEELFQREEATGKRIIGCLYDIATINWINQNVPSWPLNPLLKYILKFPKPLAKNLALKFFLQPKCPKLITNWLHSLVDFSTSQEREPTVAITPPNTDIEVQKLQQQVRVLTGSLIITIVAFSSGMVWLSQQSNLQRVQSWQQTLERQFLSPNAE